MIHPFIILSPFTRIIGSAHITQQRPHAQKILA